MDRPVDLIPLVCVKCAAPLEANPDEAAWVCAVCGQGQELEPSGLAAVEVFYSAAIAPNTSGWPFWVVEGQVALARQTYQGNSEKEAQTFWDAPRRFFIPAFDCPLDQLLSLGMNYLRQPPDVQPAGRAAFAPITLGAADVRAIAEFIVVAVEAERKDKVKEIRFTLELTAPVLWILP